MFTTMQKYSECLLRLVIYNLYYMGKGISGNESLGY